MSTMFESIVGMIAADKKDVLERLKKTTDELSMNNASLGNATQHIEALTAELESLKSEKEIWGNEFNAVIIVKEELAESRLEARDYREVLEHCDAHQYCGQVEDVLKKWSKEK